MEVPVEPTGATELQESSSAPSRRVYHFGCGPWDPAWLQCLANAKVYTLLFALFVVVEGAIVSGKYEEEYTCMYDKIMIYRHA